MAKVALLPVEHAPAAPAGGPDPATFAAEAARSLGHSHGTLTASGRAAMTALFRYLRLRREDEVFIATTSGSPHVAACVTCTVFNFAKPSRVLTDQTRAIVVIHEFGVPDPRTPAYREEARQRGIPLIEDCAHTVASVADEGWHVGALGDWAIVSFPKIFPVRAGGLLAGPPVAYEGEADGGAAAWWPSRVEQMQRRREVYAKLTGREAAPGVVPWFFPVMAADPAKLMGTAREARVECGLWHGTNLVVLPCHQFLGDAEIAIVRDVVARGAR